MKASVLLTAAFGALALAQGVTDKIKPQGAAPAGCVASVDGQFEVNIFNVTDVRARHEKRDACGPNGILVLTLKDGVLIDNLGRTGYIASNFQFQFDNPPQTGAIYTAGFSKCGNGAIALGSDTVFYQCPSGDFGNLYSKNWAPQCYAVHMYAAPCGGPAVSQKPDGQVVGTTVVPTTVVIPLSDGQPQVIATSVAVPLCQIGDGQVQAHTTPCASVTKAPVVSQASDGQVQVTPRPSAPVSQASDGQPQVTPPATTAAPPPATGGNSTLTTRASATPPAPSVVPTTAPAGSGVGHVQAGGFLAAVLAFAVLLL